MMRAVPCVLKFLSGFTSNLITQTIRSTFNGFSCAALATACVLSLIFAVLQMIGGGYSAARKSARASWIMAVDAAKRGATSALQAAGVLTLLSPLARAAQACSESMMPSGILIPCGSERNMWQQAFGLNSWNEGPKGLKKVGESRNAKVAALPAKSSSAIPMEVVADIRIDTKKKPKSEDKEQREWNGLVDQYLKARTQRQMDSVMVAMATKHPRRYASALTEASRRTGKKSTAA